MQRLWRAVLVLLILATVAGLVGPQVFAEYHFQRGRTELNRYHAQTALYHLEQALLVWPNSEDGRILASRSARRAGDYDRAEQHLRQCQQQSRSPSPALNFEWALCRAASGDFSEVETFLNDQIAHHSSLAPLIREALTVGYTRTYRSMDALNCLGAWREQEPDCIQIDFLTANLFRTLHSFSRAADGYRRVLELDPARDDVRRPLAISLMEVGRYRESVDQWEYLQSQGENDIDALTRLARCHERLNQPDEAVALLDQVLARQPDYGPALRTRGQLELYQDRPEEAESWLRKALAVNPNDYRAHFALHQSLELQHKDQEARAEKEQMQLLLDRLERIGAITSREMAQYPRDAALHLELGKLLVSVGRKDEGAAWLKSAVKLNPQLREAHLALAEYYRSDGNSEEEEYHRQMAQSLDSQSPR